jgi:hypothetical protein
MDIMHLAALNDPDLFMKLFTGKLDVYELNDWDTWDWAIFYKDNRECSWINCTPLSPFHPIYIWLCALRSCQEDEL